uniref:MFS domain-containing protein n=1 Tax=Angiostrongylus cantonensis TaxID=6313 RepID=A0A0K0D1E6_ANGCA
IFSDAINNFDNGTRFVSGPRSTAHIFATYPQSYLSTIGAVIDQIVGAAVLCMGIAAITDRRNRIPSFLQPTYVGGLLAVIGMCLAMNAVLQLLQSFKANFLSYRSYKWFWVPIVCPMIGALIGAWLYEFFIGFHIPDEPETTYIHKVTSLLQFSSKYSDHICGRTT